MADDEEDDVRVRNGDELELGEEQFDEEHLLHDELLHVVVVGPAWPLLLLVVVVVLLAEHE